jgi:Ca2+-binding EF-hand superfamily protein
MHIKIATAIVLSLAFASQPRGWVSSVTAAAGASVGTYQISVRGNNPCGAVNLDFGDGTTAVTHAITQVPVTITHEYTRVGEYTIRARGMGNCDGDVFTRVNVTRVRSSIFNRNQNQNRFAEMDRNGDGIITRAEWRGTAVAFDQADWNNDGRLSGDEVRVGATPPAMRFAQMDQNGDGMITRAEWRGTAQAFDRNDWNNDGRLSGDEVRFGATPPAILYAEMDQNGDGVITRAEWRGGAQAFNQADWNNDGRLSGDEVRVGLDRPNAQTTPDTAMRFAEMDQNRDGIISRAEWRGNAQSFDQHDWNSDGRLSGEEVRVGARPRYEWTETVFRRLDRNRDNYLSGNEWRYEPDDFVQVDRNRDDRISLAEFLDGDRAIGIEMPGGRGRGRGRGNDQALSVIVTNRQAWTDTGIDVRAGDSLDITATGRVRFSPQADHITGPDGAPVNRANAPMPRMAVGALVARVGNSAPFFVGARANALRVPQAGRLYLGINDDILTDNDGEFRVAISVNVRGIGR